MHTRLPDDVAHCCGVCRWRVYLGDDRMKTTLNKIKAYNPCSSGWKKLLKNLGKIKADDEPLALTTILESNGFNDALWCLRAVDGHEHEMRLYAVDCARSVQHLLTDKRSLDALDVAERFANGFATQTELDAARDAASDAAWAAAWAAASDAARAAVWAAARVVARDAAWAAVWAAARDAAWAAAWAAASDAAWAAASDVVRAAARDAAWDAQANLFVLMCEGCYEN